MSEDDREARTAMLCQVLDDNRELRKRVAELEAQAARGEEPKRVPSPAAQAPSPHVLSKTCRDCGEEYPSGVGCDCLDPEAEVCTCAIARKWWGHDEECPRYMPF